MPFFTVVQKASWVTLGLSYMCFKSMFSSSQYCCPFKWVKCTQITSWGAHIPLLVQLDFSWELFKEQQKQREEEKRIVDRTSVWDFVVTSKARNLGSLIFNLLSILSLWLNVPMLCFIIIKYFSMIWWYNLVSTSIMSSHSQYRIQPVISAVVYLERGWWFTCYLGKVLSSDCWLLT